MLLPEAHPMAIIGVEGAQQFGGNESVDMPQCEERVKPSVPSRNDTRAATALPPRGRP
jgi:hypothetical protein